MNILIIIALICFTVISLLRLDLAVMFIIVLLPTYLLRFQLFGLPSTFLESMIIISFTIWFIKNTKLKLSIWWHNHKYRLAYPFRIELLLILVAAILGVAVSQFSLSSLGIFKAYFLEPILLFILILNVLQQERGRKKILIALIIISGATALFAIFQKITGAFIFNPFWSQAESRRIVSWFGYPNAVGLFLGPIVLILSGWILQLWKNKRQNIILIISAVFSIIFSLLAILFARSEGAIVAIIGSVLICLLFISRSSRFLVVLLFIFSGLIVAFSPSIQSAVREKVLLQNLSGEIRKQQWRETMQTFRGPAIFFGNGLSNYQAAVKQFHQEGIFFNRDKIENFHSILYGSAELRAKYWQPVEIYLYPHNIFLNFWTELGLLGTLVFTWLIIRVIVVSAILFKKTNNFIILGLFGAMLSVLIHGLVDVPYFKNDLSALFFIILGLLGSIMVENSIKLNKTVINN